MIRIIIYNGYSNIDHMDNFFKNNYTLTMIFKFILTHPFAP